MINLDCYLWHTIQGLFLLPSRLTPPVSESFRLNSTSQSLGVSGTSGIVQAYFNLSDSVKTLGNTVGAVVSTAHAFRLADYTADRDSHPALKLCGRKVK